MIARKARPRVRSIFLSDLHLGCQYSRAGELLTWLEGREPEYLYLVGDIIDGWRLRRKWHWQPEYSQLLRRLMEFAASGTQIRYTPGNHDAFLRPFVSDLGCVEIADEFTHATADGRQFLVLHGDQFDNVELRAQWLSRIGSVAYDSLLFIASGVGRLQQRLGLPVSDVAGNVKRRVKQAVRFVSSYEERLARHARESACDGIICGHVHTPTAARIDGVSYFNTGDWVENRSALIEYSDGCLELQHLAANPADLCPMPALDKSELGPTTWPQEARFPGGQLVLHRPRIPAAV
jgi:UDP-2,3-diacylglucosamine pyrophosphatase LpxH